MATNSEALSQRISEKIVRDLRNRNYTASPVNVNGMLLTQKIAK